MVPARAAAADSQHDHRGDAHRAQPAGRAQDAYRRRAWQRRHAPGNLGNPAAWKYLLRRPRGRGRVPLHARSVRRGGCRLTGATDMSEELLDAEDVARGREVRRKVLGASHVDSSYQVDELS